MARLIGSREVLTGLRREAASVLASRGEQNRRLTEAPARPRIWLVLGVLVALLLGRVVHLRARQQASKGPPEAVPPQVRVLLPQARLARRRDGEAGAVARPPLVRVGPPAHRRATEAVARVGARRARARRGRAAAGEAGLDRRRPGRGRRAVRELSSVRGRAAAAVVCVAVERKAWRPERRWPTRCGWRLHGRGGERRA